MTCTLKLIALGGITNSHDAQNHQSRYWCMFPPVALIVLDAHSPNELDAHILKALRLCECVP